MRRPKEKEDDESSHGAPLKREELERDDFEQELTGIVSLDLI
jgi:hypothetical protein